jgi:hypothetical protein
MDLSFGQNGLFVLAGIDFSFGGCGFFWLRLFLAKMDVSHRACVDNGLCYEEKLCKGCFVQQLACLV